MKRSIQPVRAEALESRAYFAIVAFQPVTLLPAGQFPTGLATADLNVDGRVDVVDTNYGNGTVGVMLGHGDGTFDPMVQYPVGNGPVAVTVADVNGDAIPDLLVANSGQNSLDSENGNINSVSVLLGVGDGTFGAATSFTTGTGPDALVTADFNGDGHLDIATANLLDNTLSILNGNGDGTFAPALAIDAGPRPQGLAVADLSHNGHPDLVTANSSDRSVSVFNNRGDGTFKTRVAYGVGNYPRAVLAVDLGHSGRISLVATNLEDATFSILHGNNDGTFNGQNSFITGVNPYGVAAGDLNATGRTDLVTANGNGTVSVRQRTSAGYTTDRHIFATGQGPQNVAVADFNGDGKPDLVTADFGDGTIGILLNDTPRPGEKATTTKLATSPNPARLDEPLTLTATVRSSPSRPTGTVAFYSDGVAIGIAAVDDKGVAVLTTAALPSGVTALTAQYIGDGTFAESVSKPLSQVVTTSTASGPDLVATFSAAGLGNEFVPGESGSATFRITNQGDVRAKAVVESQLFLSPDGSLANATPLAITGNFASSKIKLKPGQSTSLSATFTVPANLPTGQYAIVADLNTGTTLAETDTTNNVGASNVAYNAVNKFGIVGNIANVTLTLADSVGTPVTFRLSGPGTAVVAPTVDGLDVSITGTTTASVLTIASLTGDHNPTLHSLTTGSAIGNIDAAVANFTGTINLLGGANTVAINNLTGAAGDAASLNISGKVTQSIAMGSLGHATLTTPGGIKSLTVAGWQNTAEDRIVAAYIGTIKSAATFGPAMQLTGLAAPKGATLTSISVADYVGRASIVGRLGKFADSGNFAGVLAATKFGSIVIGATLTGEILAGANLGADVSVGGGDDTFAAGVIGSLRVGGTTDALVAAGLDPVDGVLLDGDDTLLPGGRISSLTLGPVTDASRFVAVKLPATASIQGRAVGTASDSRFHL